MDAQLHIHIQRWTTRDTMDVRRDDGEKKISNLVVFVLRLIELLATYRCEEERFHYYCWFFVFFSYSSSSSSSPSRVPLSLVVFYLFSMGRVRLFDLFYFYFGTDDGTSVT